MRTLQILALTALFSAATANAASIQFVQEGWLSGGSLTVQFSGEDGNHDGVIDQLELSTFEAIYSAGNDGNIWNLGDIQPDSFLFSDLDNFLIFAANPTLSIVDSAFEGGALATVFDSNLFPIDSTSASATPAPEPENLAIPGLVLVLLGLRRKSRQPAIHSGGGAE